MLLGKLQTRYGLTTDQAEQQIERLIADLALDVAEPLGKGCRVFERSSWRSGWGGERCHQHVDSREHGVRFWCHGADVLPARGLLEEHCAIRPVMPPRLTPNLYHPDAVPWNEADAIIWFENSTCELIAALEQGDSCHRDRHLSPIFGECCARQDAGAWPRRTPELTPAIVAGTG